jgi:competence ComEA-like helix-hairpin-helix protein
LVVLFVKPFENKEKKTDFSGFEKEIDEFEKFVKNNLADTLDESSNYDSIVPFEFDPNTVSDSLWKKLGLNEKLIYTINNYKSKGGKFYKKEDLSKIYGFPSGLYDKLSPFISLPEREYQSYTDNKKTYPEWKNDYKAKNNDGKIVELNKTTAEELNTLDGIGDYYSVAIIDYREKLGGYIKIEQIKEITGFREQTYELVKDHITADPSLIRKIDLNTIEFKQLLKHPYFDYETVRRIFKFRDFKKITNINELIRNNVIDEERAEKIKLYIDLQ